VVDFFFYLHSHGITAAGRSTEFFSSRKSIKKNWITNSIIESKKQTETHMIKLHIWSNEITYQYAMWFFTVLTRFVNGYRGGLAPQILMGFFSRGPQKCWQKKGQSEDYKSPFQARISGMLTLRKKGHDGEGEGLKLELDFPQLLIWPVRLCVKITISSKLKFYLKFYTVWSKKLFHLYIFS
jgi:hypothetical protein